MRYHPLTQEDRAAMCAAIGVGSVDALFKDVPKAAQLAGPIGNLPSSQPEWQVEKHLRNLAAQNLSGDKAAMFLGAGAYRHHIPASVDYLIQRGEFLTSYTPYQPEVSQGTLQMLFEFQTQVAHLTGMEVANASLYDGATSAAEAVAMAGRITRRGTALLSGNLHPHYAEVIATMGDLTGYHVQRAAPAVSGEEDENLSALLSADSSCLVVQNPDCFGHVRDLSRLASACHAQGVLLIVVVNEIVSLGLMPSPGSMGADIVAAEGQSLGNPLNFGGPHLGLFSCRQEYLRQMPGRLCGQTEDAAGQRGFVLTLSTREQHIRREKATSNICTNSGLCALAFSIHLSLLGGVGLQHLAALNHARAVQLAEFLGAIRGCEILNTAFFNEFTLRLPMPAAPLVERAAAENILAGVPLSRLFPDKPELANHLLLAATELNTEEEMQHLHHFLQKACA